MLSNFNLSDAYTGGIRQGHSVALRAVEAAVRADLIVKSGLDAHFECDCIPADGPPHCHGCGEAQGGYVDWDHRDCAAAIRTQLSESINDH